MTFLFDIGNVLLKLHFERFHERVMGGPDLPIPQSLEELKLPYETGQINDQEFVSRAIRLLEYPISAEDFTTAWLDIFSENQPMWDLVDELHAEGHRLILFSNTNALHTASFLNNYPGFKKFHHHHFSQEVKAMKPHPDFYQSAIDAYQLIPEETIYFDDLAENIATGIAFGFHCHQYDFADHQAALDWLRELS